MTIAHVGERCATISERHCTKSIINYRLNILKYARMRTSVRLGSSCVVCTHTLLQCRSLLLLSSRRCFYWSAVGRHIMAKQRRFFFLNTIQRLALGGSVLNIHVSLPAVPCPASVPVLQLVEGGEGALPQAVELLAQDVHLVRLRAGQLGDRQTKHIVRQKSRVSAPSRVEPS